ncbi:MAG: glycosyltransferase family 39 protein [bacterium]|nr:glycosyltransferase family 39 protein [bacterium]
MKAFRKHWLVIVLVLGFMVIYAWGGGFTSPSSIFQHDEYMLLISPGLMYMTGDWIPHQTSSPPPPGRHDYFQTMIGPPHCFHYVYIVVIHAVYLIGSLFGAYSTPLELTGNYQFIQLIGRMLVILCSAGALMMTYRIGKLVFREERIALMAVLMMGISPYYFMNSKIAKVDVPMIFFATVSMYFLLRAAEERKTSQYVWAGLFCGLSAGTKLPGAFMVFPIAFVYFANALKGRERFVPFKLMAAGLASFVGVFGTNPNLLIYFDDFIWAIEMFQVDLKAQGGIIHPWYHYYMTLDTLKFLLENTFPSMFAGQVPVYFAIGGFGAVLFRRRLREYTLLVFPMSFLLLKLPTLASNLYREYHVCIFVMALLAAYALHVLFRYTVDRFVANRAFRAVCMCLVLGWMLKAPFAYANEFNYYATVPSSKGIASSWIEKYIPAGSSFLLSDLVTIDARKYSQEQFSNYVKDPKWMEHITDRYEYALLVPFKASSLNEYCSQNVKLLKIFRALSTGYTDIYLYKIKKDGGSEANGSVEERAQHDVRLFVEGDEPLIRIRLDRKCLAHSAHTLLLSIEDEVFPVAIPEYADLVYARLPARFAGQEVVCRYTILPFELPARHSIAGIERFASGDSLIATEYLLTSGEKEVVLDVDPRDLLGSLQGASWTKEPVLNPATYIHKRVKDSNAEHMDIRIESVRFGEGTFQEAVLERKNNPSILEVQAVSGMGSGPVRMQMVQKQDADVPYIPFDYIKVEIERVDATRSTFLYQHLSSGGEKDLWLPLLDVRRGDRIQLQFLADRSGS